MNKTEELGFVVFFERIVHRILSNHLSTIFISSMIGMIISRVLDINLGRDAWFWFFSSIAQTFAALIALLAIFSVARFEYYRSQIIIHRKELSDFVFKNNDELGILNQEEYYFVIDDLIERVDKYLSSSTSKESLNFSRLKDIRNSIKNFKQKENRVKNWMRSSLKDTSIIIILSVILLPFGNSSNIFLVKLLEFPWLKLGFIFGVIGLCIASIYDIVLSLSEFFKIDK